MTDHAEPSHALSFLFSDRDELPDRYVHGNAFVGADYVSGTGGATAYERATGHTVPPREDGCYFTLTRHGSKHTMGVDYAGAKKLFYYQHGDAWCVSNSLARIAAHAVQRGLPLSVNFAQLTAFKVPGTFNAQMSTPRTILNEVRLLPTRSTITVDSSGMTILEDPPEARIPYRDALSDYVNIWLARIRALVSDERIGITADLTGGRDSRSVFALIHSAASLDDPNGARERVQFRSSTNARAADDLAAAQAIANSRGWDVNDPLVEKRFMPRLSDAERFDGWRDLCLGVYMPVYFPDRRADPLTIDFHGGGGECHRPFYPGRSLADHVLKMRDAAPHYLVAAWKRDVIQHEGSISTLWPDTTPLIGHYREFRNRLHAGLLPQYKTVMSPLNSRHMAPMSQHEEKVETDQIGFDIMENLQPGLMDLPYEVEKKRPTQLNSASITLLDDVTSSRPGEVYTSMDAPGPSASRTAAGQYRIMADHLDEALASPLVREFLGDEVSERARKATGTAVDNAGFDHPRDAATTSLALAVAFAFESAGLR